ncbi:MAG TPA: cell wall-binding repeat-containing protein [Solirubrobacteraceae bacterium]|nr:cell wall-binding repeat-containing protein [Solirubrobacteraceae bacterium]
MRLRASVAIVCALLAVISSGCGGGSKHHGTSTGSNAATTVTRTAAQGGGSGTSTSTPRGHPARTASNLGFPENATRNTTRVPGSGPVADAAGVALAVYPSVASGTHPTAVTIAPTDDWEAALASSVLMAPPIHAPVLLSGHKALPAPTADALKHLAPTGSGSVSGAQVVLVGDVPKPSGLRAATIGGSDPYAAAAQIDRFATAATGGHASPDVVIASTADPAYAMPAAGWAAESGDPILFVSPKSIPKPTVQALKAHGKPRIYVLGPPNVVSDALVKQLGSYGKVKRVSGSDPSANSVAFAVYRDPGCKFGQACAHLPGSFGWAMRSPGHGYTLLNPSQPLAAAASAALSGSGDYGPQLLVDNGSTLSKPVLNYFLNYATPGYTQEGPTAAVYNHAWVIGNTATISVTAQAEADQLLQAIPQTTSK